MSSRARGPNGTDSTVVEADDDDVRTADGDRLASLEAEVDRLRGVVLDLESELDRTYRRLDRAHDWVDFVNEEAEGYRDRVAELEAELTAYEAELSDESDAGRDAPENTTPETADEPVAVESTDDATGLAGVVSRLLAAF